MERIEREKLIAMGLFKSTVEQSTHLINYFKHKTKQDFNLWLNQGFKILETVEKENPEYYKMIEELSDIIHLAISDAKQEAQTTN